MKKIGTTNGLLLALTGVSNKPLTQIVVQRRKNDYQLSTKQVNIK